MPRWLAPFSHREWTNGLFGSTTDALNFFLADVRGGLGPFVNVYLVTAAAWTPADIGNVLAISGLIGILFHVPVGALIDSLARKGQSW